MSHPEEMRKLSVICSKGHAEKVISSLYDLGAYHILEHQKSEDLDIGSPLEKSEEIAETIVKLRALMTQFSIQKDTSSAKQLSQSEYADIVKRTATVHQKTVDLLSKKTEQSAVVQELDSKLDVLNRLKSLKLSKGELTESETLEFVVGSFATHVDEKKLKKELKEVTPKFHVIETKKNIAVFFEKGNKDAITGALRAYGFNELEMDFVFEHKKDVVDQLKAIAQQHTLEQKKLQTIEKGLANVKKSNEHFLSKSEHLLDIESQKAQITLKFGQTDHSYVISGWVPKAQIQAVKKELNQVTKSKVHIVENEPGHHDKVPTKLTNSKAARPFEFFLNLYDLPDYHEMDPSILLMFTFPLFFGLMLGDVGYGIVLWILFTFLKKKFPSAKGIFNVLIYAAIVTIIFGGVFGEYFGFEHVSYETGKDLCFSTGICFPVHELHHHGEVHVVSDFPRLMNRVHSTVNLGGMEILSILVVGIICGFLHLNFGLFIGFLNKLHHGFVHAFLEKISWMFMQAGVILFALSAAGVIGLPSAVGAIVFIAGTVMIYLGDGVQGVIELPAIFSNMLSYMRLGAVGLASVGLAVVVNENFFLPYIAKGGVWIVVAVFAFIVGHIINIILGVIGPFLHSTRLHYVEFFSKFYKGGGVRFSPFGVKEESE